jgi:hypothetical protein
MMMKMEIAGYEWSDEMSMEDHLKMKNGKMMMVKIAK